MNDFEQKLARQTFREPPAGLRAEILRACAASAPAAWTWRDWFWPSPQAWAALAALWVICAAVQLGDRPAPHSASFAAPPASDGAAPIALLTVHTARDFRHVLDLAN
jgi:hypothetical protein